MDLRVCPHASLPVLLAAEPPALLILLGAPDRPLPAIPDGQPCLATPFHDIADARPGLRAPDAPMVATLLQAGRAASGPVLVSCEMGVSRAPAIAYALACAAAGPGQEEAVAAALRVASPVATPNPLIVRLADAALGRGGRMVRAVAAIGRGRDYAPYRAFRLPIPEARA